RPLSGSTRRLARRVSRSLQHGAQPTVADRFAARRWLDKAWWRMNLHPLLPPAEREEATMNLALTGKHLIAGEWTAGTATFQSSPATGAARSYAVGTPEQVARAVEAAEEAFGSYGYSS